MGAFSSFLLLLPRVKCTYEGVFLGGIFEIVCLALANFFFQVCVELVFSCSFVFSFKFDCGLSV